MNCYKDKKTEQELHYVSRTLFESRILVLSEDISDAVAKRIVSELLALSMVDKDKPITMFLNSAGGSISSGFAIYDTVRALSTPVKTVACGVVASMGVTIFLAVPKQDRLTFPNTRFMIHQPLISGTIIAPASDVEINAKEMIKLKERLNKLISEATNQPLEKVEKDTQRDFWLNAEQAVEYGLAGKIITSMQEVGFLSR